MTRPLYFEPRPDTLPANDNPFHGMDFTLSAWERETLARVIANWSAPWGDLQLLEGM